MQLAFWLAFALVVYVYAGYPLLLGAWARLGARPWTRSMAVVPSVSIVLAARNEAGRMPGRLANLLALDYPAERLEIIVVSNGSTDGTTAAVLPFVQASMRQGQPRVRLLEREDAGKAAALNSGVAAAAHEVLVFADARQRFARSAVRELVANFADPSVGGVSGELVLDCEQGTSASSIGDSVGAYWRYEKWLRRHEARVDSMVGATGAIYALRRKAWRALPPGTILDDVLAPMQAVLQGWRVVFEPAAQASDVTAADASAEVRRKTRTLAGNWQLLGLAPRLLVPGINRTWLQYWSHKVGRLLVPFALAVLFASSLALAGSSLVYMTAVVAQILFLALAWYGGRLEREARPAPAPVNTQLPAPADRARGKAVNA